MTIRFPTAAPNDNRRCGALASRKVLFGDHSRYALAAVHTRFDAVEWFVWDADVRDNAGLPDVIRQAPTAQAAVDGLI